MKTVSEIFKISILLLLLGAVFSLIYVDCHLEFDASLNTGQVVALLLNFGVLATIIERLATQILLQPSYNNFMSAHGLEGYGVYQPSKNILSNDKLSEEGQKEEDKKEFKAKLFWISLGLGAIVSSLGFRFFYNVIIEDSLCTDIFYARLFVILDVFLTAVLLSGGSAFVLQIILWFKNNK